MSGETTCAYCCRDVLTGDEDPEHIIPASIRGRFITRTVCNACNRSAGRDIDQPWLEDPFVRHMRFEHAIPDRRGMTVAASPLLTGTTSDGLRVTLGRDGEPRILNTSVQVDEDAGTVRIAAANHNELERQTRKQVQRLEKAGRTVGPIVSGSASTNPSINGESQFSAARWVRMAAKVALASLAEQQPTGWRGLGSARILRTAMTATSPVTQPVSAKTAFLIAPAPASAVVLCTADTRPIVVVSLMGIFEVGFVLEADLDRNDWAWIADPLSADADDQGPLAEVIYRHQRRIGLI